MKQSPLFPLVHQQVIELLNGYVLFPEITDRIEEYIVPPALGDDAGIIGAFMLAKQALKTAKIRKRQYPKCEGAADLPFLNLLLI